MLVIYFLPQSALLCCITSEKNIIAAPQLVHKGDIDYLVADYLSEITMSLLTAAKRKNPVSGITYHNDKIVVHLLTYKLLRFFINYTTCTH